MPLGLHRLNKLRFGGSAASTGRAKAAEPIPAQPLRGSGGSNPRAFAEDLRVESRGAPWIPLAVGGSLSFLVLVLVGAAALIRVDRVVPVAGRLQPQRSTQEIAPPEQGVVRRVLVGEGDTVEEGQVLVVLDTRVLQARQSSLLQQAEDLVRNSRAEVDRVAASLQEERSKLVGDRQQLALTEEQLAQLRPLAEEGGYGQLAVLDTEKSRAQLLARISETQARITRLEAESAQRQAELSAAMAGNSAEQVATDQRLREIVLRAPVEGTILDLEAKTGLLAPATEPLLKLVPTDNLQATVYVPDQDLAFVRPGQDAELEFPAYRRDTYGWLEGTVTTIGTDALPPDQEYQYSRFPVNLALARQYLEADDQRYELQAGMAVVANLRLDKASLMELWFSRFTGGARAVRTIR
ncbi:HlyD family efflux transporter periplasmic adaptor subunit [Synechococcus sp. RSCCF101]|uniref:HlyD family secretion protein n=1 Tax=Synechococcus sp. RSCCF101 TaxID=2511069 RepID=UPI001245BDC2|nr:HlyD family efflux transporter periplasmic adaptor subunit [Synechococcus sp. RSCCF101]QEY31783.1 HlyD family efflux transporter periplasmic adaptor subunit [Synechococcus sp. RSCCF101]